jgi:hypothetical protein
MYFGGVTKVGNGVEVEAARGETKFGWRSAGEIGVIDLHQVVAPMIQKLSSRICRVGKELGDTDTGRIALLEGGGIVGATRFLLAWLALLLPAYIEVSIREALGLGRRERMLTWFFDGLCFSSLHGGWSCGGFTIVVAIASLTPKVVVRSLGIS